MSWRASNTHNEVGATAPESASRRHHELDPVAHTRLPGPPGGFVDRALMAVDAKEGGARKGLGNEDGADPAAEAQVGHHDPGLQLGDHTY